MTVTIQRGDARKLDLPDNSVDTLITSPPYWAQRSYVDNGEHYDGQIGDEPTPHEYLDHMIECMREWVRVLKKDGNIWVNLGDKYLGSSDHGREKSLCGLPWRFAIRCMDEVGLILRSEVIWDKANGLPESVTDRARRSHEQWFHFTVSPKHYAAVDRIRSKVKARADQGMTWADRKAGRARTPNPDVGYTYGGGGMRANPLGALPNSVWLVPTEPLMVPDRIAHAKCCNGEKVNGCEKGLTHYAAFPMEFPRLIIEGWTPSGICTKCGEGRRPAAFVTREPGWVRQTDGTRGGNRNKGETVGQAVTNRALYTITGEVCKCTPYTDHEGVQQTPRRREGPDVVPGNVARNFDEIERTGPWREYHYDQWDPAPTTEAVVLDPFGGTGTVALVADVLGRHGIYNDASADYCFLAQWRTTDANERARALRIAKPPKQLPEQISLWDIFGDLDEEFGDLEPEFAKLDDEGDLTA